jgi:hypothetical protein
VHIQDDRTLNLLDSLRQSLDYFDPATLAKIWHTLDETIHTHPYFALYSRAREFLRKILRLVINIQFSIHLASRIRYHT